MDRMLDDMNLQKPIEKRAPDSAHLMGMKMAKLRLSPTQQQILAMTANGMTRPEIAEELGMGYETVKERMKQIYQRLGAKNGPHAVYLALKRGIIE